MKYVVCQDGDKWYIQDNPESETWIAEFNSEIDADKYCKYLNRGL